jgi:DNA-binding GntR family transcriptional regulator
MKKSDIKRYDVITKIIESIRSGEFQRGDALTERALALKYNVSRTPVREAFRCLEEIGLVKSEPHKCVRIASYSKTKISNHYDVRELLEGLSAYSAAKKRTPEQLNQLHALLQKAEHYAASGVNDADTLAAINIEFHGLIAQMSQNDYLIKMLQQVFDNIGLLLAESLRQEGRAKHTLEEHWLIYQAIRMGYADLAESAARTHIRNAYQNVISKLSPEFYDE